MDVLKNQHILIENVTPSVDGGRYPAKATQGENCLIEADAFRDGIEKIRTAVVWRHELGKDWSESSMSDRGNDRWQAYVPLHETGRYEFFIRAWTDAEGKKTDLIETAPYHLVVDRPLARFGSWYEMFIRSQGKTPGKSGTFRDAQMRLEDIRTMGFDVVYLEPIHPVGRTARKGRNNSLTAESQDPGSPWAIGNENGGHTAIEPALGTLTDFDHFVETAAKLGIEVALDFAPHCSPDHPWVKEHPSWFYQRPDGTIKCHENPPFKYEDVYPLDFDSSDSKNLYEALLAVFLFWVGHGVKIFRVDNPHTKPVAFWEWIIREVKTKYPDVIFLGEAFTRPLMMKALSKAGFSQSYTYFMWRNSKHELTEYVTELAQTEMRHFFRPNFFVTTPDVLPSVLQNAAPSAFKMRLALAATLSPSYGIINGYELCENKPMIGTDEYLDSEKYEIKVRNWDGPGNIKGFVSKLNAIRKSNSALQSLENVVFVKADNDAVLAYVRMNADKSNVLVVVVNLDPHHVQETTVHLPLDKMGLAWGAQFVVEDLIAGISVQWSEHNPVRLDPQVEPAQIFLLRK